MQDVLPVRRRVRAPWQRFTVFPLSPGAFPWCIVAGPDGNLWFTITGLGRIGHINP